MKPVALYFGQLHVAYYIYGAGVIATNPDPTICSLLDTCPQISIEVSSEAIKPEGPLLDAAPSRTLGPRGEQVSHAQLVRGYRDLHYRGIYCRVVLGVSSKIAR